MSRALSKLDALIDLIESTVGPSNENEYKMAQAPNATTSWVKYDKNTHFPIQNIPFGVFQNAKGENHVGTAIGDYVLDLYEVSKGGLFKNSQYLNNGACFLQVSFNNFTINPCTILFFFEPSFARGTNKRSCFAGQPKN